MRGALGLALVLLAGSAAPARAYSVLTHEALIDASWDEAVLPSLKKKFPQASEADLSAARAYVYGGCIIQDMGYFPFGSKLFTDLVHYVRPDVFVTSMLDEAQDPNEYAFALGALAHYAADTRGHRLGINRAVPVLYSKLHRKYGDEVTYEDKPSAHLKTEFSFDVLQVARGRYATQAYHDFIGFQVAKPLLERAFQRTYGLPLSALFTNTDLAINTYRRTAGQLIPKATKLAWAIKGSDLEKTIPGATEKAFVYRLSRVDYEKEWGAGYQRPGFFSRLGAFFVRILPKVGPLKALGFRTPTPQAEKFFEESFTAAVDENGKLEKALRAGKLDLAPLNFDTGEPVHPGAYALADRTWGDLVLKLEHDHFKDLPPELGRSILDFYAAAAPADAAPRKDARQKALAKALAELRTTVTQVSSERGRVRAPLEETKP